MPTVALSTEFFDAFAAWPRAQQNKVREFSARFLANPASAAIHYEKIHDVKDDKVRTVRIDNPAQRMGGCGPGQRSRR
jgi:hypothetical protein